MIDDWSRGYLAVLNKILTDILYEVDLESGDEDKICLKFRTYEGVDYVIKKKIDPSLLLGEDVLDLRSKSRRLAFGELLVEKGIGGCIEISKDILFRIAEVVIEHYDLINITWSKSRDGVFECLFQIGSVPEVFSFSAPMDSERYEYYTAWKCVREGYKIREFKGHPILVVIRGGREYSYNLMEKSCDCDYFYENRHCVHKRFAEVYRRHRGLFVGEGLASLES